MWNESSKPSSSVWGDFEQSRNRCWAWGSAQHWALIGLPRGRMSLVVRMGKERDFRDFPGGYECAEFVRHQKSMGMLTSTCVKGVEQRIGSPVELQGRPQRCSKPLLLWSSPRNIPPGNFPAFPAALVHQVNTSSVAGGDPLCLGFQAGDLILLVVPKSSLSWWTWDLSRD